MTALNQFVRRWGTRMSFLRTASGVAIVPADPKVSPLEEYEARNEFERVSSFSFLARSMPVRFTHDLRVNPHTAEHWAYDEDNILNAIYLPGNQDKNLEKFSWNPVTGEWLFIPPGQQHAVIRGNAPFDDYVRGIVLHQQKRVTLRPFWPTWIRRGPYSEFGDEESQEVSFNGQFQCQEMLERNGARGWDVQLNINNRMLEDMTGRPRNQW